MESQNHKRVYVIQQDGRKTILPIAAQLMIEWGDGREVYLDLSPHPWGLVITDALANQPVALCEESSQTNGESQVGPSSSKVLVVRPGASNVLFVDIESAFDSSPPH